MRDSLAPYSTLPYLILSTFPPFFFVSHFLCLCKNKRIRRRSKKKHLTFGACFSYCRRRKQTQKNTTTTVAAATLLSREGRSKKKKKTWMNVFFFLPPPLAVSACVFFMLRNIPYSLEFFFTFLFFKKRRRRKGIPPFFNRKKKTRRGNPCFFFFHPSSLVSWRHLQFIYLFKNKISFFFVFFFWKWQMHNGNEIINFLLNIWTLTNREKVHFLSHRVAFWNLFWKTNELNITRKEKSYSTFEGRRRRGRKNGTCMPKKKREFRSRSCVCVCVCVCAYFCLLQRPLC